MDLLPDHVERNRAEWSKWAPEWVDPGRQSWARDEIVWGIWEVAEAEYNALGDLSKLGGLDAIELGCGTAYFSAWLAKLGANPVGIDVTASQLETARHFQAEFGLDFPLIEASAEHVPFADASFDLAISEYGASIWCDPYKWIPEAARLLRPGGHLVFLRNTTLSMVCSPDTGPALDRLCRDWFDLYRLEWPENNAVEFHIPTGEMFQLLKQEGFRVDDYIEIRAPENASSTRFDHITLEWSRRWPSEEIWRAEKVR